MSPKILLLTALLIITATAAQAWDDGGHLLIGEIAARQLRPEVVKKMEALLPLLDTKFNDERPYNLVTAGTWMDDMRGLGQNYLWKTWHYVDAPCAGNTFVEPPPPHALWALDQATASLRNPSAEPKARAEALGQIIHLVGDIHQPLHTADRNDSGGNGVHLAPLTDYTPGPSNLHAFWDTAYRYDATGGKIGELWPRPLLYSRPQTVNAPGVIAEQASLLLEKAAKIHVASASKQPWHEWAYETHMIACQSGWPQEAPDAATGKVQLTPAFVHTAHEIATQQIVKAGTRLAALLNELLGENQPKKARQP